MNTMQHAGTQSTDRQSRLSRRGRQLRALLLAALMTALIAGVVSLGTQAFAGDDEPVHVTRVTVQPGDTLWGIASAVAPDRDVRDAVAEIRQSNRLTDSAVHAGDELIIPAHLLTS